MSRLAVALADKRFGDYVKGIVPRSENLLASRATEFYDGYDGSGTLGEVRILQSDEDFMMPTGW